MIEQEYRITFEDGVFKELFLKFIQYKKGLGFKYGREIEYSLSRLNKDLNSYDLEKPRLSKKIVETLANRIPSEASATQFKRIGLLRHFAIFLNNMGYEAYVYPHLYNVNCSSGFSPYIFSHEQISGIIHAADSLEYCAKSPAHHIVWPTFVRILYGCGLRLSEALRLTVKDVDLFHGVLYIEKSKKNTSRFVPMSASLIQYCVLYAERMKFDMNGKGYFFPAPDNGRYGINTAQSLIKKVYALAGILPMSNGRLPRIHDIRHTFSCHSLEKMQEQGVDLYYSLPILSNYLGHQGIRDTEKYLRLAIFKFPGIVDCSVQRGTQ